MTTGMFGHKNPEVFFKELLESYKATIHRYYDVTRRRCVLERGSSVAFELTDIFRERHFLRGGPE